MTPNQSHVAGLELAYEIALANGPTAAHAIGDALDVAEKSTPAEPVQGEVVEVVAHMYQHDETGLIGFVDQQQVDWGFEKNNPRLQLCGPLMTVAQHNRIVAALTTPPSPDAELVELLSRVQVSLSLDDTEWGYSETEKYTLLADIRAKLASVRGGGE